MEDGSVLQKFKCKIRERLHRLSKLRAQKDGKERTIKRRESKQRHFNDLPKSESEAFQEVFLRFDTDRSGYLDRREILHCLRELGLRGDTVVEKRDIWQICTDAGSYAVVQELENTLSIDPNQRLPQEQSDADAAEEEDSEGRSDSSETAVADDHEASGSEDEAEAEAEAEEAGGPAGAEDSEASAEEEEDAKDDIHVDLYTFALTIVPQVRQRLAALQGASLLRYFCGFEDASGRVTAAQCVLTAKMTGCDHLLVEEIYNECARVGAVDFHEFQLIFHRVREATERTVRAHERKIKASTQISHDQFAEFRQDLITFHNFFVRYARTDPHFLTKDETQQVMKELGLFPVGAEARDEIIAIVEERNEQFYFGDFLNLVSDVRSWCMARKLEFESSCFKKYDVHRSGELNVGEVSALLTHLGCTPKSRKEQEALAALIRSVDADGSGLIDFEEFQVLSQRIEEHLRNMQYEAEFLFALEQGFQEKQVMDMRLVFDRLDRNATETLDASEVRTALALLKTKQVTNVTFDAAWSALGSDVGGRLGFHEYAGFMHQMHESGFMFAEEQEPFPKRLRQVECSVLRRCLEICGLCKNYVSALGETQVLALSCSYFEVAQTDNIQDKLHVNSMADLFVAAENCARKWQSAF